MQYAVSMVVPCYNHGRYLRDLLNSLLGGETCLGYMRGQDLGESLEIIIVDDCSTDDTASIIELLKIEYPSVKFMKTKVNSGTAGAINIGMRVALGDYFTTMSADDMREPGTLKGLLEGIKKAGKAFVYDDMILFSVNGRVMSDEGKVKVWRIADYDFEETLYRNQVHAGIMFPRKAFEDIDGYPEEMRDGREDWAVNVKLGIFGYCGTRVNQAGYLYRREGQNRTLRTRSSEWQAKFYAQMTHLFPEIYAGERPMGCCGGRGRNPNFVQTQGTGGGVSMLAGSEGMTALQYIGESLGNQPFWGPSTGVQYIFSKGVVRLVANSDLHAPKNRGLLDLSEYGKMLFQTVELAKPPSPEAVPTEAPKAPEPVPYTTEKSVVSSPEGSYKADDPITRLPAASKAVAKKLEVAGIATLKQFKDTPIDDLLKITSWPENRVNLMLSLLKDL